MFFSSWNPIPAGAQRHVVQISSWPGIEETTTVEERTPPERSRRGRRSKKILMWCDEGNEEEEEEAAGSRKKQEDSWTRDGPTTTSLPSMLRLSFSVVKKYQPHHVTWLRKLQFASLENSYHVFIRSLRSPTSKFSDQMAGHLLFPLHNKLFYWLCLHAAVSRGYRVSVNQCKR